MAANSFLQPTLIFIPDISGFTHFINETEVEHSTHIIQELLEIIIESNTLNMTVSEIEGDAILFYRTGDEPSFKDATEQVEIMFLEFHRHLAYYDRDRICDCGACSSASKLTLKFVYHYGNATIRKIANIENLFGPDVTLAHKLLKNSLESHEYFLMTDDEMTVQNSWVKPQFGADSYDGVGEIKYNYYSLEEVKSKISELPNRTVLEKYKRPVVSSIKINSDFENVYTIVTDASLKTAWVKGLKSVSEERKLSTIGGVHQCIMPNASFKFEVTEQDKKGGVATYAEKTDSIKWLSPLILYFSMTKKEGYVNLQVDFHYKKNGVKGYLLGFPLRIIIKTVMRTSLKNLKKFIEQPV